MSSPRIRVLSCAAALSFFVACGDATTPDGGAAIADASAEDAAGLADAALEPDAGVDPGPSEPVARLEGTGGEPASEQLTRIGPFSVSADEILAGELIATRLEASLSSTVTLDALNLVLANMNLRVAMAREGSAFMTLAIPRVANATVASQLADQIRATGAFYYVAPAHAVSIQASIPGSAGSSSAHLDSERFQAAWNMSGAATTKTAVRCADSFLQASSVAQLPSLRLAPGTTPFRGEKTMGVFDGNHGFWTMSILAASVDELPPTGTSFEPERLIDLECVQSGGRTFSEAIAAIKDTFPASGPFVISLSIGSPEQRTVLLNRVARVREALQWRLALRPVADRVVVFSAAGNAGAMPGTVRAELSSPINIQAKTANLESLIPVAERPALAAELVSARRQDSAFDLVRGKTLIVGASDTDGDRTAFSQLGEDVRMIGDVVMGSCSASDALCDAGLMLAPGTSASTPQAAGAAAFLWSLDPTLTPTEIVELLTAAYDGRWIDAFSAALALEGKKPTIKVRDALLDFNADLRFDEADIMAILAVTDENDMEDLDFAIRDFHRADLNGDGYARSDTALPFDLSADAVPSFGLVTPGSQLFDMPHTYDENGITDVDILCFYAASGRYQGNAGMARLLLEGRCNSDVIIPAGVNWIGTMDITFELDHSINLNCGESAPYRTHVVVTDHIDMQCLAFDPTTGAGGCFRTGMTREMTYEEGVGRTLEMLGTFTDAGDCPVDGVCTFAPFLRCVPDYNCAICGSPTCNQLGTCSECEITGQRTQTKIGHDREQFTFPLSGAQNAVTFDAAAAGNFSFRDLGISSFGVLADVTDSKVCNFAGPDCSTAMAEFNAPGGTCALATDVQFKDSGALLSFLRNRIFTELNNNFTGSVMGGTSISVDYSTTEDIGTVNSTGFRTVTFTFRLQKL